jgi:hypothetical protein
METIAPNGGALLFDPATESNAASPSMGALSP